MCARFLYATDDEDIPHSDSRALHGLLLTARDMSISNRDAHTGILSTVGLETRGRACARASLVFHVTVRMCAPYYHSTPQIV